MEGKRISARALANILANTKGATMIGMSTISEPKLLKRNRDTKEPCPFSGVRKVNTFNGMINFHYENNVNAQREREGSERSFVAQSLPWGERIGDTCLIRHKGRVYVQFRVLGHTLSTFIDGDGNVVPRDILAPFLPLPSESKAQGLEREIIVRTIPLDTITSARIGGQNYEILGESEAGA